MANPLIKSGVGQADIQINQGATFDVTLTYKNNGTPIDLTGYSARMHLRLKKTDATPIIELTTANGRLTLGYAAGTIRMEIDDAQTAAFTFSKAFYDLELISGAGIVSRLMEGKVILSKETTK